MVNAANTSLQMGGGACLSRRQSRRRSLAMFLLHMMADEAVIKEAISAPVEVNLDDLV